MAHNYLAHTVTPAVLAAQQRFNGRRAPIPPAPQPDALGPDEAAFIAARDSFYLGTVNEEGWPYIQHRGGPAGFLQVLAPHTLAFADLRGNRQLLSTGNLGHDPRVSLFLMDYVRRERLKILGRATVVGAADRPDLVRRLAVPGLPAAKVERIFQIEVVGFDWNCPQYIKPRYTAADLEPLRARIAELEAELAKARA
jgi:uncharacterized protein